MRMTSPPLPILPKGVILTAEQLIDARYKVIIHFFPLKMSIELQVFRQICLSCISNGKNGLFVIEIWLRFMVVPTPRKMAIYDISISQRYLFFAWGESLGVVLRQSQWMYLHRHSTGEHTLWLPACHPTEEMATQSGSNQSAGQKQYGSACAWVGQRMTRAHGNTLLV